MSKEGACSVVVKVLFLWLTMLSVGLWLVACGEVNNVTETTVACGLWLVACGLWLVAARGAWHVAACGCHILADTLHHPRSRRRYVQQCNKVVAVLYV